MQIRRDNLITTLSNFAFDGNGIIIGPPGVGKTFALKEFVSQIISQNIPCLYLPIDKLGVDTETGLKAELEIKEDIIDFLRSQRVSDSKTPGILVIDAFDAARSETSQRLFLSLTHRVIDRLHGSWNVIVSVRTYDAKKSEELQDLFPVSSGSSSSNEFQISGIHCRHFAIPKLTDDEIKAVETCVDIRGVYERGSKDFKELLKIPFNLWLLEKLLLIEPNIPELSSVTSEVQLLGLFWKQRVTDGRLGEDRRVFLSKVARKMVVDHSLSARTDKIYSGERDVWKSLLSSEILTSVSTTDQRVAFSHNILFDYAVSVLLIEDEPDKLVEFISEDLSRPLFLRPSLSFYFTRLWHDAPDLFWKVFWHILTSSETHLRLFARLIPTSVITNEAKSLAELDPLLDLLSRKESLANEALLRLIQAHRVLEIRQDDLWVQFLDKASEFLDRKFAWELSVMVSDILSRAENAGDDNIYQICGRIGRRLLDWIWQQRKSGDNRDAWMDKLSSSWVIPIVAKTFRTDLQASRTLLEKVLDLVGKEKDFPIDLLYRLTDNLDRIWPYDPEFAALTYQVVFGYYETSEEKTPMGLPVMPLVSTRRQDYESCQYNLIKHFPNFLRAAPVPATQAMIRCLNYYIIGRHVAGFLKEGVKLEDLPEEFQFRGSSACYIADSSCIWDDGGSYAGKPIKMANELFGFIAELSSCQDKVVVLNSLLDVFRDNVQMAFFWKRLLNTAAQYPGIFAPLLFELCIARPILAGLEAIYELGLFLDAAARYFDVEQLCWVEEAIMALPEGEKDENRRLYLERHRDRLLARIPSELLKTQKARNLRMAMESANRIPENRPLVSKIEFSSEPYSEKEWLQEQGVNVERPENQEFSRFFTPLEEFTTKWRNNIPELESIKSVLPVARELYIKLSQPVNADKQVLDSAWTKLASCAETMSRGIDDPESEEFQFCRSILLICMKHELPKPDPENDSKYSIPSWSVAPRNEAAMGLLWLASCRIDSEIITAIETLIHEPVPSVRFLVTSELFRILRNAPETFWNLTVDVAEHEPNQVVQKALCQTLGHVLLWDEIKTTEVLEKLFDRAFSPDEDSDLLEAIVFLVVRFLVLYGNKWAEEVISSFLEEPVRMVKPLKRAVYSISIHINLENFVVSRSRYPDAVERTIAWLSKAIDASIRGIRELRSIKEWDEDRQSRFKELYDSIDHVTTHLYQQIRTITEHKAFNDGQRREFYKEVKPILEQILKFALDKENGVMFAPTAHHFMELLNDVLKYDPKTALHMASGVAESSKAFSYNLDPIAVHEVVKLIETILADHRGEVRGGESLQDLLNLLDIFAEVGWPEALNVVWQLDEIFR